MVYTFLPLMAVLFGVCHALESRFDHVSASGIRRAGHAGRCQHCPTGSEVRRQSATAYKWLARQQSGGIAVLADRSRRPKSSPAKSTDATERLVLEARDLHPVWGARKLRQFLIGKGHTLPAISTVNEILRRHQRLGPRAGVTRDCQRFEHPSPNDL